MSRKLLFSLPFLMLWSSCSQPAPPPEGNPPETKSNQPRLVEITTEAQKHVGLQVAAATVRRLTEHLQVAGTVQPVDSRVGLVRPVATGRIAAVLVKVGDRIDKGRPLATFDNSEAADVLPQYLAARTELERLNTQLAVATRQTERMRRLVDIGAAARKELELSEAELKNIDSNIKAQQSVVAGHAVKLRRYGIREDATSVVTTSIDAPFSGIVTKVEAAPGEMVTPESELFQVADVSQIWVQAEVFEKDLGRLVLGETASITFDTYPDEEFLGKVTYIGDVLDPQTRTTKVRCELPNPNRRLKLDMFATVHLPTTFDRESLAIPTEAIQQIDGKNVVFLQQSDTKFELRAVEVGRSVKGLSEIFRGLKTNEPIVIRGAFHLKSIVLGKELGEEGEH
jgi:cobalt-zinc-cadmium efflux system membrane fusion protein